MTQPEFVDPTAILDDLVVSRETESVPIDVSRETSDEAPYGYTTSGRPRMKPGPRRGLTVGQATRQKGPKRSRKPAVKAQPADGETDPRMIGATALISIPATLLSVAGTVSMLAAQREPEESARREELIQRGSMFTIDAATISIYGGALAEGLVSLSDSVGILETVLNRMGTAGMAAGFLGTALPLIMQILANHGVIPAGINIPALNVRTLSPGELIEAAQRAASE